MLRFFSKGRRAIARPPMTKTCVRIMGTLLTFEFMGVKGVNKRKRICNENRVALNDLEQRKKEEKQMGRGTGV